MFLLNEVMYCQLKLSCSKLFYHKSLGRFKGYFPKKFKNPKHKANISQNFFIAFDFFWWTFLFKEATAQFECMLLLYYFFYLLLGCLTANFLPGNNFYSGITQSGKKGYTFGTTILRDAKAKPSTINSKGRPHVFEA